MRKELLAAIHGQCFHEQAVAHAFVVKNLMRIIGLHVGETNIVKLAYNQRLLNCQECYNNFLFLLKRFNHGTDYKPYQNW